MPRAKVKKTNPVLSVVLSFKNEESNIPTLWTRIKNSLESFGVANFEVIFVNDASDDSSEELIRNLAKSDSRITLINMTRSFGNSECVIAGLSFARAKTVVYMDSDLQDPPELIPKLVTEQKRTGVDVVHTRRTLRKGESAFKLFITRLGYFYLGKFSSPAIPREMGDYKLLSRRVVDAILETQESRPFLRGIIQNFSFPNAVVEYQREARLDGRKNSKFRVLGSAWLNNHLNSTLISFSDSLLKFALKSGALLAFFAFLLIPVVICLKYTGIAVYGWAGPMIAILFFGGLNLLFLGILGLYINSVFLEVKNRPLYVIKDFLQGK